MTRSKSNFSPIAIVGVSALFPGSRDARGFWRDILAGQDLLTDVPSGHWLIDDYYDADPSAPDKTYARRGGFLDKVDFDALAWGVPPSTVPATDTSQLLALILAQQARHYPLTKAILAFMERLGDGPSIASAMGVWAMAILGVTLIGASGLMGKRMGAMFRA